MLLLLLWEFRILNNRKIKFWLVEGFLSPNAGWVSLHHGSCRSPIWADLRSQHRAADLPSQIFLALLTQAKSHGGGDKPCHTCTGLRSNLRCWCLLLGILPMAAAGFLQHSSTDTTDTKELEERLLLKV